MDTPKLFPWIPIPYHDFVVSTRRWVPGTDARVSGGGNRCDTVGHMIERRQVPSRGWGRTILGSVWIIPTNIEIHTFVITRGVVKPMVGDFPFRNSSLTRKRPGVSTEARYFCWVRMFLVTHTHDWKKQHFQQHTHSYRSLCKITDHDKTWRSALK